MGINSIQNELTKDTVISTLRLDLGADFLKQKLFIVVEGRADIKFLNKFINKNKVELYESYAGKNGVHTIISDELFANEYRVIGIRDRDYETLHYKMKQIFFIMIGVVLK